MLLAQSSWAMICLNLMFVLRSIHFQAPCYVYAQIYMPMCSLPCLCLYLHAMCSFPCLQALCHAYAQIHVFICSMPCLCVQIYMLVAMPCASIALLFLDVSFLRFGSYRWDVDIDLVFQAYTHTPRPISKGLGHFLYACLCLLAYFYALCQCLPIQIQALPCFVPSRGLCLLVFEATCLCVCICPCQGLFGCNNL